MPALNTKRRSTTFSAIVGSAAFQAGVRDFQNGAVNFDAWAAKGGADSWRYERGRLFAAERAANRQSVPASRVGGKVSPFAISALIETFRAKAVL
jgi:hypothetical protein